MIPSLTTWLICRNESRDIARCLRSIESIADRVVIVDTGSTDDTIGIARETVKVPLIAEVYTDASARDAAGDWRLQSFSKARNRAIELAEATQCTHWMWIDADDELVHPQAIRRALYLQQYDTFACWIQDGSLRWIQHRVMRAGKGIRFAGACHEYPIIDGLEQFTLDDCTILHHGAPSPNQEDSNARNLRLLMSEWEREPSTRTAFYIASTHRDGGRHDEAVRWYQQRVSMDRTHPDEWLFACLYGARCARLLGNTDLAESLIERGLEVADGWAEFHVEQAWCAYVRGQYEKAITILAPLRYPSLMPIPVTHLWREPSMYRDQPLRLMSWCYEHLGRKKAALAYAEAAARDIEGDDLEWSGRIARLRASDDPKPAAAMKIKAIALCRPGAIGDILMTLNLIPLLRESNPGVPIHYFCAAQYGAANALGSLMHQAGVDVIMDSAQWGSWRDKYERAIDLVGYPLQEGYPEKPMRQHLLRYFAEEMGLTLPDGALPQLTVRRPPPPKWLTGEYITLQYKTGWSKYKQWPYWQRALERMPELPQVVMIDESQGMTPAESIAVFANSWMHLGVDSLANHLTHYLWAFDGGARRVPGVIVFGSTQADASGYPDNINLSAGLHCQPCFRESDVVSKMPRGPCINPPRATYADDTPTACMEAISVERVVQAVREMWGRAK